MTRGGGLPSSRPGPYPPPRGMRSSRTRWWWTHGLPPVGVAGPGITLIVRCLRRSGVDAVPATGAGERVDERPVGRGRSPATFAAQHLGSTCWPSSVSQRRGRDQPRTAARRGGRQPGVPPRHPLQLSSGRLRRRRCSRAWTRRGRPADSPGDQDGAAAIRRTSRSR